MERLLIDNEAPVVGLHIRAGVKRAWDRCPENLSPKLQEVITDITHLLKVSQRWQLQAFCKYPLSEEERVLACIFFSAHPRKFFEPLYDGQFSLGPYLDLKAAFDRRVVPQVPFYVDHPQKAIAGRAVVFPSRPLTSFPDAPSGMQL